MRIVLPTECELGIPQAGVERILEAQGLDKETFWLWMRGQTTAICDGRRYNHVAKEYETNDCGPHGTVVYSYDVVRYLRGVLSGHLLP